MTGKNSLEEMMMWDTLGVELMGGVPILQSLRILGECFPSYTEEIQYMHDVIKSGESVRDVFDKYSSSFHPGIVPLVLRGEEDGELPSYLFQCRDLVKQDLAQNPVREPKADKKELDTYAAKGKFFGDIGRALDSGSCVVRILKDMAESKTPSYVPASALTSMRDAILSGSTLQEALNEHKEYFDSFDVNMMRAGECSGCIGTIMDRLEEFYARKYEAKSSG
ncbi:Type II secretion system (T2SS), protein F [uncultured archaeon]|nr:Type II secretion system (T2SS), protein F [uncultured archaeon]